LLHLYIDFTADFIFRVFIRVTDFVNIHKDILAMPIHLFI